jgi:hypothetical protein
MSFLSRLFRRLKWIRQTSDWSRDTLWRQGSTLSADDAKAFNLARRFPGCPFGIVISHSCDIVNDDLLAEPDVELAAARLIDKANPNFTHAKNTRLLHVGVSDSGKGTFAELSATKTLSIPKRDLAGFQPNKKCQILPPEIPVLQDWLASRYKRAAFPDQLNDLLSRVDKTLEKIGKNAPHAIRAVYVEYEPENPVLEQGELYEVRIHIVFATETPNAEKVAQEAAEKVAARFRQQFMKNRSWQGLELRDCRAISDTGFTYYDISKMKRYRLDHISLKQEPPEDPDVE